jgi:tetrapyrrole methylase family protein/MazG family protein
MIPLLDRSRHPLLPVLMTTDPKAAFEELLAIVRRLRAPDGCPWDREQTPESLRASILEEAYESVAAITAGDDANLKEELGDLYMLATMVSWMKEQGGAFTVAEVLGDVCRKLVRRHPHVFGESDARSSAEVVSQWDRIKTEEKKGRDPASALARLPGSLPPLERAARIQRMVSKVGFDWKGPEPVWGKLHEEIAELEDAVAGGDSRTVEDEVGDLLFTVVNLSRLLGVDPGIALHGTNEKFARRFRAVEERLKLLGVTPAEAGLERMDQIWNQVKRDEQSESK